MPTRSKHPCSHAGCPVLTDARYCPAHAAAAPEPKSWRTTEGSASSRGYGAEWRRLRALVLARDPVCTNCQRAPSTTVDHIRSRGAGGDESMENLRGLCRRCHDRKSAADGHEAKRLRAGSGGW